MPLAHVSSINHLFFKLAAVSLARPARASAVGRPLSLAHQCVYRQLGHELCSKTASPARSPPSPPVVRPAAAISSVTGVLVPPKQRIGELETDLARKQASVDAGRIALEQERITLARTETQRDESKRYGGSLTRGTMASALIRLSQHLVPVVNLLKEIQLSADYLQLDETRRQVLKEHGMEPTGDNFSCPSIY